MKSTIATRVAALTRLTLIASLAVTLWAAAASAGPRVYVVTSAQQFGTVDLASGAFHPIGAPTPEAQANLVWWRDGTLLSLTVSGNLVKINPATGEVRVIGPTGLGFNAFDLGKLDGRLYVTDFSNNIYSVDADTGLATLIGPTGIPSSPAAPFSTNPDGTINLFDESLYAFGGKLYATFDAFTLDPVSLAMTPAVCCAPALYRINPHTGVAVAVATTDLNLGATVKAHGKIYAFKWVVTAFTAMGPQIQSELLTLDLENGGTSFVVRIDPAAAGISGAATVRRGRWESSEE